MPQIPRYPIVGGCRLGSSWLALLAVLLLSPILVNSCSRERDSAQARDLETLARRFEQADGLVTEEDRESWRRAATLYLDALELAREVDEPLWQAEALQRLGRLHRKYLEEPREAIGYYRRALPIFEDLGRVESQSTVLINLGRLHYDLGEMDRAVEYWERALPFARRSGDRHGEAGVVNNLALAARHFGDAQKALTFYDRSIEILEGLDLPEERGRAFFNRGRLYQALGQSRQALADLDRAFSIGRDLEEPRLLAMVLTAIGQIRKIGGDLDGALEALEEARRLREATEQERGLAVTLLSLGSVYEELGREEQAAELDHRALAIFRRHQSRREVARALTALGRLETTARRTEEALRLLAEALPVFRDLRDPAGEIGALLAMAHAERARGDPAGALRRVEEALGGLEELRSRAATQDLRRSFAASHRDPYDFHIDLLMELDRRDPGAGYATRALEAAERSRARSLLELLTENRETLVAGADPELLARERDLEHRLALVDQRRLELLDQSTPATPEQIAGLETRLDDALRELRAVRGQIFAESPRYASLARPPRFGVRDIQTRALDAETVLLEVHLGAERSHLWAVTPDSVTSFELPPRSEIEEAARNAHELLEKSHQRRFQGAAALALDRLSHMVLDPVADLLGDKRLLIAADGALHYVPFAALPLPGASPASPLISVHEVVHVPSASALIVLRDQRDRPDRPPATGLLAVIADPVFDLNDPRMTGHEDEGPGGSATRESGADQNDGGSLGRLRFSRVEAESILDLAGTGSTFQALGFEATREAATAPDLGRYRIVHFSTHGRIDAERPELSQLVFSRFDRLGRPREGSLLAHEVFDLDLPAELVVLSACETALGQEVRGEGLVGLTQGFLSAGAAAVLVSLWRVDDRATARLMERFYRRLLAGGSPAESLREAQLSLREETGWRAPYYWAGFVLQGEWRQRMAADP